MDKEKERREIYTTLFIRSLAIALVGIFVPAYLVTLGYSVSTALVFLVVTYVAYLVFSPIAARVAHSRGLKSTILISPFITIAYLAALYGIKHYPGLLYPTAIIGGAASMLFWVPMNAHFAANTEKGHAGEESGYFHIVGKLARIIGPLAGGLVIAAYGFGLLFAISAGLLALCAAPLFLTKDSLIPLKDKITFTRKNMHFAYVFAIQGVFSVCAAVIFPFYIYLQTTSFESTGFVMAAMGVGMLISAIIAGKVSDKVGKHETMRAAAVFSGLVWISAIFLQSAIALYVISALIGVSTVLLNIAIFGIFCDKTRVKKSKLAEHMVVREIGLNIGRIFIFIAMLAMLTYSFELAFVLSAASSLFFVLTKY